MKRYRLGIFKGAPAMFEQPDGTYVKLKDVRRVLNHLERPAQGWSLNTLLHAVSAAREEANAPRQPT